MSKLSLTELEKVKNDLIKWIKSEKDYLDDYKEFYFKDGEFYFFISFSGIHRNNTVTKLNDLWDIKTGKPLSQEAKNRIKGICENIFGLETRLKKVDKEILMLKVGKDLTAPRTNSDKTRKSNESYIKDYLNIAFKLDDIPKGEKYISKTLYRKLSNPKFLLNLSVEIVTRLEPKYNLPDDKRELLEKLKLHISSKYSQMEEKKKPKKQPKTIQYRENLDYSNQKKRKKKNPEY